MYQYNICVSEGIRYIIGQYEEGIAFGWVKGFVLAQRLEAVLR